MIVLSRLSHLHALTCVKRCHSKLGKSKRLYALNMASDVDHCRIIIIVATVNIPIYCTLIVVMHVLIWLILLMLVQECFQQQNVNESGEEAL